MRVSRERPASSGRPAVTGLMVTPGSIALVFGVIVAALVARNVLVAGRRPLGWAVAAVVLAALVEPAVSVVGRRLRRGPAVVLVILALLGAGALVGAGVLSDADRQVDRLRDAAPEAALRLEQSDRFGDVATEFRLTERVREVVDTVRRPSAGLTGGAAGRASTGLVVMILTVFALIWGGRFGRGAVAQIPDERLRSRVQRTIDVAFRRSRRWLLFSLAQAAVVGALTWALCRVADVPAAAPLALIVAAFSIVPGFGIMCGALPVLLLEAGLDSLRAAGVLALVLLVLQVVQAVVVRPVVVRRSIVVGPAAVVISLLLGYDVYGIGGALGGLALTVFAVALIDTAATAATADPDGADGSGDPAAAAGADPGAAREEQVAIH